MAIRRRVLTGLLGALLLVGCGTQVLPAARVVADGVAAGPCIIHPTPDPGPFLQCPIAVDLAAARLNLFTGTVLAVEFHRGNLCPPNARCLLSNDSGTVVFWFEGVAPVMVRIAPNGMAGFVAAPPESLPEWLLDQGPAPANLAT